MTEQELLTTREAADYLRVHVSTLKRWRNLGIGPASVRFGDGPSCAHRYLRTTLDRWVKDHERAGARKVTR